MSAERKILFITSRNIINTSGELRLIKNRTSVLDSEWEVITDFIVFSNKNRYKKEREEIGARGSMTEFRYSKRNIPGALLTFFRLMRYSKTILKENKYEAIILSGVLVLSAARYFKKKFPAIKIVADIHGASEELIEFNSGPYIRRKLNRLAYRLMILEHRRGLKYCDAAFVVSKSLKEYVVRRFGSTHLEFLVVPCSVRRSELSTDKNLPLRDKWRKELGLGENSVLFVYSGGISPWQSIDDAYSIFCRLNNQLKEKDLHFLIMTFDPEKLRHMAGKNITVRAFKPNEVQEVLYAGDYAFLLRGNYVTNNVAFPNKFFEYVISGMRIICTPYIYDIEYYVRNLNLGIIIDTVDEKAVSQIASVINNQQHFRVSQGERQKLVNDLCFETTLKPFASYIGIPERNE